MDDGDLLCCCRGFRAAQAEVVEQCQHLVEVHNCYWWGSGAR